MTLVNRTASFGKYGRIILISIRIIQFILYKVQKC